MNLSPSVVKVPGSNPSIDQKCALVQIFQRDCVSYRLSDKAIVCLEPKDPYNLEPYLTSALV